MLRARHGAQPGGRADTPGLSLLVWTIHLFDFSRAHVGGDIAVRALPFAGGPPFARLGTRCRPSPGGDGLCSPERNDESEGSFRALARTLFARARRRRDPHVWPKHPGPQSVPAKPDAVLPR